MNLMNLGLEKSVGVREGASLPITVTNLVKTYGDFRALDGVTLDARSGEFLTLLGPSGSGKTTLLMVLAGFVRPDSGSVRFADKEVLVLPPHKRDIGMVFQNYALFPHMTVAENLAYPLKLRKFNKADIAEKVEKALDLVKLGGLGKRNISELSGGQRQRIALARAVIFEPRILLMDEPLSALDKNLREQMQLEIRRLHDRLGVTTVYVTHDQREALTMSDRIAVMDGGRLQQVDSPKALYERPRSHFVADFMGESYSLPVTVDNRTAYLFGKPLSTPEPIDNATEQYLVLRPEKLCVVTNPGNGLMHEIEGVVRQSVFQGDSVMIYVTIEGDREIAIRLHQRSNRPMPEQGEPIVLGLRQEDIILVPRKEV